MTDFILTLAPSSVVESVVKKLNENKTTLRIKIAADVSEDTKDDDKQLRPPYCAVYPEFEVDTETFTGDGTPLSTPVEIKILCSSRDNKSAALSFAEAFRIATAVTTLLRGIIEVTQEDLIGEVDLLIRRKPFAILRNSAEQAVVQVNLYYEINSVGT